MKVRNILLLAPLMLCALTTCQRAEKHFLVGVSQCSDDVWRNKLNTELRIGSYYYNNLDITIASAGDNDARQIQQIDSLVNAGVDMLVVSPNKVSTISDAIDRAYDKGIPVILFDRKSDSPKYTAYMGADNYDIGRSMGNYLASKLKGSGKVVEITGLKDSSPAIERHKGFVDALKKHPNIQLLESRNANWLAPSAHQQMDSLMAHHNHIDAVFAHNDRMALAARDAMKAAGRKDSVLFVGVDALPMPDGGLDAVRERRMVASCLYPTRGDRVIELAMNILEGRPYMRDNKLPAILVTQENANLLRMQAEELKRQYNRLENIHDKVDDYLTRYRLQTLFIVLLVIVIVLILLASFWLFRYFTLKHRISEEAAKAKLKFFTNVSHEFRTPLTLISDPIERLMADEQLSSQQHALLEVAHKNTHVLLRLVNEIMDLRKVQNGKMPTQASQFDFTAALQRWVENFQTTAQQRNITLVLEAPETLSFVGDIHKTERICYNLLSNALKFTNAGGEVRISAQAENEKVELRVSDTGKGIAKEHLARIFDSFFQSHNNDRSGTGIGLAVVKAFVEVHGGNIRVESELNQGTTFIVTLAPLALSSDASAPTSSAAPNSSSSKHEVAAYGVPQMATSPQEHTKQQLTNLEEVEQNQAQVLVVDDHQDIRDYVSKLLNDANYKPLTAKDGEEGLQLALRHVPDLVVCDVSMPNVSGLELCRRLKANEVTSHIPVILLTANALDDQRAEGYENGADAYITKPFSGKVLLSRIENLLHNRKMLRDLFAHGEETLASSPDADTLFLENFKAKVKEKLSNTELNVEDLSAELGMSRVQLYRKVKALTGSSPVELIRITRLKRAEVLLMQGGKTIAEVAYEVGFSSPSYFSKCFKDYFGCLPGSKVKS